MVSDHTRQTCLRWESNSAQQNKEPIDEVHKTKCVTKKTRKHKQKQSVLLTPDMLIGAFCGEMQY